MDTNTRGILYASITAALWGFLAIALKMAVNELSAVTVTWLRFATAAVTLGIVTLLFRRSDFRIFRKFHWLLPLTAFFLGFNYLGFISGINYVSPSTSQVFIMVGPVSFALSGIIIFREKVTLQHIIGFIVVVAGIFLFYSEQIRELIQSENQLTRGMLLIFGGGLSWAVFASLQKQLLKTHPPNQLNLFIYTFCALMFLPFAKPGGLIDLSGGEYFLMYFLGLNTVLAYGSLALAIKYTQANKVSVIITLNPIITFVTMAVLSRMKVSWIDHESYSYLSIIGALAVLAGAITVILAGRRIKK